MIIEINYRAIKWDNHQGGSGLPYNDRLLIDVSPEISLAEVVEEAHARLNVRERENFTGEVELISIIIL